MSSFESLVMRGYDVMAVVMIEGRRRSADDAPLDNVGAVRAMLKQGRTTPPPVIALPPLPDDTTHPLHDWYESTEVSFNQLWQVLQEGHLNRSQRLKEMVVKAEKQFWYPFTQHKDLSIDQLTVIDSAYDDYYTGIVKGQAETLFDACASWWTQVRRTSISDIVALAVLLVVLIKVMV